MHACMPAKAQSSSVLDIGRTMGDWWMMDREWASDGSYDPYSYFYLDGQEIKPPPLSEYYPPHAQHHAQQCSLVRPQALPPPAPAPAPDYQDYTSAVVPRGENPREIRNRAEKQRRDKLNHSISELASLVPPVMAANKKIDKTGVLRLTAHYLRSHQYVFGDSIGQPGEDFSPAASQLLLSLLGGFLLTTTYRGLVVVVSQNIEQYLGHTELELLGQNIFNYIHPDDHGTLKQNLMPNTQLIGPNGELLLPYGQDGKKKINAELANDKRRFLIRFKKHTQRSEPTTYVRCYVEGTLRVSDRACGLSNRACQMVRRARARSENPCNSGNDVVFIGLVRPTTDTFVTEKRMEAYRMEYRTRHSVDGEIMECDQRISMVAGYMTHEVNGVNAMNFIHKDDVRWVIFNLRAMYEQLRVDGESCYRLRTKGGQFIYMRTRGYLDVDENTRAVRSFVCTNSLVDEEEGKHFIKIMKKRCFNLINCHKSPTPAIQELKGVEEILQVPESESAEDETLPVQDLERVILYLVTNLPSPRASDSRSNTPECEASPAQPLTIIPPKRERTLSAIEKISSVIKAADKRQRSDSIKKDVERLEADESLTGSSQIQHNLKDLQSKWRLEEFSITTFTGQMDNPEEHSALPSVPEMSSLAPVAMAHVPPPTSVAGGTASLTEKEILQFLNTGNLNAIQGFGFEATPPQSSRTSRKRGQSIEQSNVNKKKNSGIEQRPSISTSASITASTQCAITQAQALQTVIPDGDLFPDFDLNNLDVDVLNLEDLDPSTLWDFKKPPQ